MNSDTTDQKARQTTKIIPKLHYILKVRLVPDKWYGRDPKRPKIDIEGTIYVKSHFKKTPYPIGKVVEIFKNRVSNEVWVSILNRVDGIIYSVPVANILDKLS